MPKPFVHWIVHGLAPYTTELPEGAGSGTAAAAMHLRHGRNSAKQLGYLGPAPPREHGLHHYHFEVFALDERLDVPDAPTRAEICDAMRGHVLAHGDLVGTYERT